MHAGNRLRDRNRVEGREETLDERLPPSSPATPRSMHAVEELAHRDHTDRPLLLAEDVLEAYQRSALRLHDQIRVNQDGQWPSGGPASARIDGGRQRSRCRRWGSSRKRSTVIKRRLGGPSSATVTPLRRIFDLFARGDAVQRC